MRRAEHLIPEINRLSEEAELVYRHLVLPGWNGRLHGLPDTLFGYMMGTFARLDLISAYWKGTFSDQTIRMVSFMERYMNPDRRANSLAVQVWRHKLMHTSSPRPLRDQITGSTYLWLLHWSDDHLPREQHFKFQPNGLILNISLFGLIDDTRIATTKYISDLTGDASLQKCYDKVERELVEYEFRSM